MTSIFGSFMTIQVEREFAWVLMVVGIVAFECLLIGFFCGGGKRKKLFTEELLAAKYGE